MGGKGTDHADNVNTTVPGGWNGGAVGDYDRGTVDTYGGGGGGATDIRITNGTWDDAASLYSRIIVAGGGGGVTAGAPKYSYTYTATNSPAIAGGNVVKTSDTMGLFIDDNDISWISSNQLGVGKNSSVSYKTEEAGGGGGGGYWGGDSRAHSRSSAGSGGTSYVSGYSGAFGTCDTTYLGYQKINGSNLIFTNVDFQRGIRTGHGYAKITFVE